MFLALYPYDYKLNIISNILYLSSLYLEGTTQRRLTKTIIFFDEAIPNILSFDIAPCCLPPLPPWFEFYFVIFVGSCDNEIEMSTTENKKFANLLQLMTLTMFQLTNPYCDNSNINVQNSNLHSSSRQRKLTDGLLY